MAKDAFARFRSVMNMSMKHSAAARHPDRRTYGAEEILFNEGELGDRAFLIESGLVRVYRSTESGRRLIGQVGPGGIVGEMALIDGMRRMATVVAAETTSCIVIEELVFKEKLKSADPFLVALLRLCVKTIRSNEMRIDEIERGDEQTEPAMRTPIVSDRAAPDKPISRNPG
jgi:CRP-like cAMP-binding protein